MQHLVIISLKREKGIELQRWNGFIPFQSDQLIYRPGLVLSKEHFHSWNNPSLRAHTSLSSPLLGAEEFIFLEGLDNILCNGPLVTSLPPEHHTSLFPADKCSSKDETALPAAALQLQVCLWYQEAGNVLLSYRTTVAFLNQRGFSCSLVSHLADCRPDPCTLLKFSSSVLLQGSKKNSQSFPQITVTDFTQ